MSATLKTTPLSPQAKKDLFKDFPDWYLKPLIEEGLAAANAEKMTDGKLVFKRLREKFAGKYGTPV